MNKNWKFVLEETQNLISKKTNNEWYNSTYRNEECYYWHHIAKWIWQDSKQNKVKSILDIGPGYGTLLLYSKKLYNCEAYALDMTNNISESLMKEINFQIRDIETESQPFRWPMMHSRILMTEILEHFMFNPIPTLKKINHLLDNDGILFLSTPRSETWSSITNYYKNIDEMPNPPNKKDEFVDKHVYQYIRSELFYVLEESGFTILKEGITKPHESLDHHNIMARVS